MALTIKEVAARLKLPVETVQRWVRQGKIPMQRKGEIYTIRAEMLARWADDHKLEIQDQTGASGQSDVEEPAFDSILLAMKRGGVFYDVDGSDRDSALRAAVSLIPNVRPNESDLIYQKLIERELLASTGIGHGIALPHPRSHPDIELEKPQITTCFLSGAINFGAIDGQPVTVLMVLLSHSTKQHLAMLSKLSFYLRAPEFRNHLLTQQDQSEIYQRIAALEAKSE